jgi:transposase
MSEHDISDGKWAIIAPMLTREPMDPRGRPPKDNRLMFNAILWILKTGAPWRDLHLEFGPWQTVYKRFARWAKRAVWDDVLLELSKGADPEALLIDASYVKLHQHGSSAKGGNSNWR